MAYLKRKFMILSNFKPTSRNKLIASIDNYLFIKIIKIFSKLNSHLREITSFLLTLNVRKYRFNRYSAKQKNP